MTVAVLIVAAGRHDHLRRVLYALGHQTRPPDDVVVVDLGERGELQGQVVPPARLVDHPPAQEGGPLELAGGRNAAAARTDAGHLVFLDVDCIPSSDLVERYDDVLHVAPGAIACGPVRYLREQWQHLSRPRRPSSEELDALSDHHPARPARRRGIELNHDHDLFWSLSFGVTRRTWQRIGGFDDSYVGYGGEDTDFAMRARQHGVPLAWFDGGVAYHQWHPPSRTDPARLDEMIANAHRFHRRWGRWPMSGWFEELSTQGQVRFQPGSDLLVRADER